MMLLAERANSAMLNLLNAVTGLGAPPQLDPMLEAYLSQGLALQKDGTVVSVAASRTAHASRDQFDDAVSYEAFTNKLHIDDWCSDAVSEATLEQKLAHALALADRVGAWAAQESLEIAVVISADVRACDVVFRFHRVRPNEPSWVSELGQFVEPVLERRYQPDM